MASTYLGSYVSNCDGRVLPAQWKNDEMDGEVVCTFVFGFNAAKEVQLYKNGEFISKRGYDTAKVSEVKLKSTPACNLESSTSACAQEF